MEYSASSNGPWITAGTVTNTAEPYTSGAYTYDWTAERNYYWRMVFEGTAEWAAPRNVVLVKVRPRARQAGLPGVDQGRQEVHRVRFAEAQGPQAGSRTVKVKAQRYASGKWRSYKSYTATNADSGSYSKYSVRIKITQKGKYRFYATTVGHDRPGGRQERVQPDAQGEVTRWAARRASQAPGEYHAGSSSPPLPHVPLHSDPPSTDSSARARPPAGLALHRGPRAEGLPARPAGADACCSSVCGAHRRCRRSSQSVFC